MVYDDFVEKLKLEEDIKAVCKATYENARHHIVSPIYKYYSLNENLELNNNKLSCLSENKIYLASRSEFNDPYDDKGYTYQREEIKNYAKHFGMEWILADLYPNFKRIACFTMSGIDNLAMWAHYSNNHQGYCVEYNPNLLENFELKSILLPVEYVDKKIDLTDMIKNRIEMVKRKRDQMLLVNALTWCSVFLSCVKHNSWSYEQEIRSVRPKSLSEYINAVPNKIYIGSMCKKEYYDRLIQIGRDLNINVYRMGIDEEDIRYKLRGNLIC